MADVKGLPVENNKNDKHNTGNWDSWLAPADFRPPSAGPVGPDPTSPSQPPVRPLNRVDSRAGFPPQQTRPTVPPTQQLRPQFQPGGPVTSTPQFAPRPGPPLTRAPAPAPPGVQQTRPIPPPLRPGGPQSIAPQGPKPLQSPTLTQAPQRFPPPPNNLQFGPRQPPQLSATTPDGSRPQLAQQPNGVPKNGAPPGSAPIGQLPRQPSQDSLRGLGQSNSHPNKPVNLDNQAVNNENQNVSKAESGIDMPGAAKGRSYSIAAAPGTPSPLKMEDDRRKSVSAMGGRLDDFSIRSPGLGLIQEGIKDNEHGSKESVRSEVSIEGGKDTTDRPESRIAGSKMTESFMGTLPTTTIKKKSDDDDDVVLQNTLSASKYANETSQNQKELSDRSPSLTRSDDSPEPKKTSPPGQVKPQNITPDPQRPKTPKVEAKLDLKTDSNKEYKPAITPSKTPTKSPTLGSSIYEKPNELNTMASDQKKMTPRKSASASKSKPKDGDNDSGVDESTQGNDVNGSPSSPNKKLPSKLPMKEKSSNSIKPSLSRSSSKSATAKTPENPLPSEKKKVPMNKIQVGSAPSPNIKQVKSKIGSLENATYKPGGGKVKIENRKLEFGNVTPKIAAKNDAYTPSGGTKKITTTKLEWNVKSKVGSLQNAAYKPGGGDKKIETVKVDFKASAKPKVASTVNITHKPGGGAIKPTVVKNGTRSIENQKLEFKAQSKVGSLDNVKHKPGGGDIKIFDDKDYIKQISQSPVPDSLNHSRQEDPYYMSMQEWTEEDRPLSRCRSARAPRTPRTPRALSPRKQYEEDLIKRNNERNRRASIRPASARDPPRSACSRRTSLSRPAFTIY